LSQGKKGQSVGLADDGGGVLHHHGGRGFILGRIQPQQGGFVLLHGQGEVQVAGLEGSAPEDVPAEEPLRQEGIAVPLDVLGQKEVGAVYVLIALGELDPPAGSFGIFRDLLEFSPAGAELGDLANPLADFGFGGFGHGASGVGDDAE
jgi:hypothetical protein